MRYRIMIARPMTDGRARYEVANFCSHAWKARFTDDWLAAHVEELLEAPVVRFPTDVSRNVLVEAARQHRADILFMLDDDAAPDPAFFKWAIQFLTSQPEPSVVGCPYLAADGEIQVFRWAAEHSMDPRQPSMSLLRVPRADGFLRKGVEQVASVGTHCIAYDLRVFDQIDKPYYRYAYNSDHTKVLETEDCYCHRQMHVRGIPIFVNWDLWAGHAKVQVLEPLAPIPPHQLPQFWRDRCCEYLKYTPEGQAELAGYKAKPTDLLPDVQGWLNDPEAITCLVAEVPDGGKYVEVGTWQGKSAIFAALEARRMGKRVKVWTIDTFRGSPDETAHRRLIDKLPGKDLYQAAVNNLKRYKVDDVVAVIKDESTKAAKGFDDDSLDVVYLDGDHTYEGLKADLWAWHSKVKPGGILAGDDYAPEFPGVIKAVDELLPEATITGRTWEWRKTEPRNVSTSGCTAPQRN